MIENRVRLAVVGLGFGRLWVPSYKHLPDVEYVGICDLDEQKLKRTADNWVKLNKCTESAIGSCHPACSLLFYSKPKSLPVVIFDS